MFFVDVEPPASGLLLLGIGRHPAATPEILPDRAAIGVTTGLVHAGVIGLRGPRRRSRAIDGVIALRLRCFCCFCCFVGLAPLVFQLVLVKAIHFRIYSGVILLCLSRLIGCRIRGRIVVVGVSALGVANPASFSHHAAP
jgi:hypothetical protein